MQATPDMALLLVPGLLGFGASALCPVGRNNAGNDVPFRPPAAAFGVVWPVLYLLLGACLRLAARGRDAAGGAALAALVAALTAWIPVTSCASLKREGVWLLLVAILACGYAMVIDRRYALLLLPLLVWLSFATLMSAWSVGVQGMKDSGPLGGSYFLR